MMTSSPSDQDLTANRLRQKVMLLEHSLAKVSATRKQLRENGESVRAEIAEVFQRDAEFVRNREQQLVQQLDSMTLLKDEALSRQQAELHETLGACRQGLDCLTASASSSSVSSDVLQQQITSLMNRIANSDLRPQESPTLALEVDRLQVRRAVQNAARLVFSRGCPRSESQTPQCLPSSMMEEYEEEHGAALMTKSIQACVSQAGVVRVQPPKLSYSNEQWLLKEALTSPATPTSMLSDKPPLTLSSWLQEMRHQVEPEPIVFENFEIAKKKNQDCVSEDSFSIITQNNDSDARMAAIYDALFAKQFDRIKCSPDSDWLMPRPVDGMDYSPMDSYRTADDAEADIQKWLIGSTAKSET